MSSIIKSQKVAMGEPIGLDSKHIIKFSSKPLQGSARMPELRASEGQIGAIAEMQREEIEEKFMREARAKSELFFKTEMQKAKDQGMVEIKNQADEIIKKAEEDAENIINEVVSLKEKAMKEHNEYIESVEKDVISLAIDIAERIVNREIQEDNEYILDLVSEAMEKVSSKKQVNLKVAQEDYSTILGNVPKLIAMIEGFSEVNVVMESSLSRGSCIVETPFGSIDGGVNTRIEQIRTAVDKIINR